MRFLKDDDILTIQRMVIQELLKIEMVQDISKFSLMAAGDMIINAENSQIKNVEKHKPYNLEPDNHK